MQEPQTPSKRAAPDAIAPEAQLSADQARTLIARVFEALSGVMPEGADLVIPGVGTFRPDRSFRGAPDTSYDKPTVQRHDPYGRAVASKVGRYYVGPVEDEYVSQSPTSDPYGRAGVVHVGPVEDEYAGPLKAQSPTSDPYRNPVVANTVRRDYLVERMGGFGAELFDRLDDGRRDGEGFTCLPVREARQAFATARRRGHGVIVRPQRTPDETGVAGEFLVISLDDVEDAYRASAGDIDWVEAFRPTADLPAAEDELVLRKGAPGRRLAL